MVSPESTIRLRPVGGGHRSIVAPPSTAAPIGVHTHQVDDSVFDPVRQDEHQLVPRP